MSLQDTWPAVGPKRVEVHLIYTVPADHLRGFRDALDLGTQTEAAMAMAWAEGGFTDIEVKCMNVYDEPQPLEEVQLREAIRKFLPLRDVAMKHRSEANNTAMVEAKVPIDELAGEIGFDRYRAIFTEEFKDYRRDNP